MAPTTILTLVGSLRAGSINRQLAEVAAENAPDGVLLDIYQGLGEVPFYNEDLDTDTPPATVAALREAAARSGGVLLVTPEYNGSIPAVLKNAIDWLSRPYGAGDIKGKPIAVIGTALGQHGGVWAHDDTRKSAGVAGGQVLDSIKVSLSSGTFDGKHPRENADVVAAVRDAVGKLAAEVG